MKRVKDGQTGVKTDTENMAVLHNDTVSINGKYITLLFDIGTAVVSIKNNPYKKKSIREGGGGGRSCQCVEAEDQPCLHFLAPV